VESPLTRGCKKRKRHENEDVAENTTASGFEYQAENTMNIPSSGHRLPRKEILPTATTTTHAYPVSRGNVQIPQNTLLDISNRHSSRTPGINSEQVEYDGHIGRSTFDVEQHSPIPLASFAHTQVFRTSDLISDRGLYRPHQITDLSLEANFNRNSTPICPRPYGSTIFMHIVNGDIGAVYGTIKSCEGSW